MKKTIAEIVAQNSETLQTLAAGGVHVHLRDWFNSNLAESPAKARARWGKYLAALKEIGIDYDLMRAGLFEKRAKMEASRIEAATADAPLHIVYCDAAICGHGAKIGVIIFHADEKEIARSTAFNGNCRTVSGDYDQFAAECFGVLKAVEAAKEKRIFKIEIRNDRISSFTASTKRDYCGAKYLWIAKKIASENNMAVTFSHCAGADNLADGLSRSHQVVSVHDQPASVKPPAPAAVPATAMPARSDRGPQFEAWFTVHAAGWPAIKEAWKAEGLTSKQRDQRLVETVNAWAKTQPQFAL